MKVTFPSLLFITLLLTLSLRAEETALVEFVPEGVTPAPDQKAITEALAEKVFLCNVGYDSEGNVRSLELSNHAAFMPPGVEKEQKEAYMAGRPGLDAETFSRVAGLPKLKALRLLKQPLPDEAYEVLKTWPDLEAFLIEGHEGDNTGSFMLYINGHPELRWLELKHLFGLDGTTVDQLDAFPKLERLELDNASATNKALPFLARNPQVIDFELHRSNMTNEEIGQLVEDLPNLERLALKPSGGKDRFDHRALAHVAKLEKLKSFGFHHWKEDMIVWDDGIEHLAKLPNLEFIELPNKFWDLPAIQKLREAKPNLENKGKAMVVEFDYEGIGG